MLRPSVGETRSAQVVKHRYPTTPHKIKMPKARRKKNFFEPLFSGKPHTLPNSKFCLKLKIGVNVETLIPVRSLIDSGLVFKLNFWTPLLLFFNVMDHYRPLYHLYFLFSGQSYKHFTIVNYNSRVVITSKLLILTTLES